LTWQAANAWQVDFEDVRRQVDDKTVAIVVVNPSNPCGSVYTKVLYSL
jgi:tyrosine aminotransferase